MAEDNYLHIGDFIPAEPRGVGPVAASALEASGDLLVHRATPNELSMRLPLEANKAAFIAAMRGLTVEDTATHPCCKRGYHLQLRIKRGVKYGCGSCGIDVDSLTASYVTRGRVSGDTTLAYSLPSSYTRIKPGVVFADTLYATYPGFLSPYILLSFDPRPPRSGGGGNWLRLFLSCGVAPVADSPTGLRWKLSSHTFRTTDAEPPGPTNTGADSEFGFFQVNGYAAATGSTCSPTRFLFGEDYGGNVGANTFAHLRGAVVSGS